MTQLKCLVQAVAKTIRDLQQRKPRRRGADVIEALEPRCLLSTVTVDGTTGNDVISIDVETLSDVSAIIWSAI